MPTDTTGREEVLRSIAAEARREGERSLAEAETEAAALVEAARRSVATRVAAAVKVAEGEEHAEAARTINEARRRLVHRRAEQASRRLDLTFEAAAQRLDEIASGGDPERWARALEGLVREGCRRAGPGATVEVRACDVALVEPAVTPPSSVVGTLRDPGVRVRSADGRGEIDGRLVARLERARSALACQAAATLGLGTAEAPGAAAIPPGAAAVRSAAAIPPGAAAVRSAAPAREG